MFTGQDVHGATLGIVGMGRIGLAVARRAHGFAMHILYHDARRNLGAEQEIGATYVESLDDLLAQSDFVSLHVPLLAETRHLMDADRLRKMKRTAILINTSRGPVVDEKALAHALKEGVIAGAACCGPRARAELGRVGLARRRAPLRRARRTRDGGESPRSCRLDRKDEPLPGRQAVDSGGRSSRRQGRVALPWREGDRARRIIDGRKRGARVELRERRRMFRAGLRPRRRGPRRALEEE